MSVSSKKKKYYHNLIDWQKNLTELLNPKNFKINQEEELEFIYSECLQENVSQVTISRPLDHTMSDSIDEYTKKKIPVAEIKNHIANDGKIEIHGIFPHHFKKICHFLEFKDLEEINFNHEKSHKKFNFIRPYFWLANNNKGDRVMIVTVPPGKDYILHYCGMVLYQILNFTHYGHLRVKIFRYPLAEQSITFWTKLDEEIFEPKSSVIVGYTYELMEKISSLKYFELIKEKENDYYRSKVYLNKKNNKKITVLGVNFSFWGNISAKLTYYLLKMGVEEIIYIGKLGTLGKKEEIYQKIFSPSKYCVVYHDKIMCQIEDLENPFLKFFPEYDTRMHVSVPTVLEEDYIQRDLIETVQAESIDNEISQIAFSVKKFNEENNDCRKFFSLHFATDYIRKKSEKVLPSKFDLSNTDTQESLILKKEILEKILEKLVQYLDK